MTANGFRPHPLTRGGHRQTLLGFWVRRRLRWRLPTEEIVVDAGDEVRLLLRASWQPGSREAAPALLLVHGLGGHDGSTYLLAAGLHAYRRGWHVVRANLRGAGDSLQLCPLLYNAGLESDVVAALGAVARVTRRVALAGVSLGGNLALLAASRSRERLPLGLLGVAAICPPVDLAACADALDAPASRLYRSYFMGNLKRAYAARQALRPDLYAAGRERGCDTIRGYDDAITAPYAGFGSAAEYYARSSSGPWLERIGTPTLILSAADDPLIPAASVASWAVSPAVRREVTPTGGHTGFVAPTSAPGRFWAAERVVSFFPKE